MDTLVVTGSSNLEMQFSPLVVKVWAIVNFFNYSLSHVEWSIGFLTTHWYGYMKLGPFSHIGSLAPSRGHKMMGSLPFFKTFLLIRLTPFVHACHDKFCWPPTLQIMIFAYFRVPYVMKIFAISKMSPTLKCTNFLAIIMQKLVRFDWFFWFLWFFIWPPILKTRF